MIPSDRRSPHRQAREDRGDVFVAAMMGALTGIMVWLYLYAHGIGWPQLP